MVFLLFLEMDVLIISLLIKILKENNYNKWLVIEAEQDPKKANPLEYAKIGI